MPEPSLKELLGVAVDAAYAAGRQTLAHFNTGAAVEWKGDNTPVTLADRESEEVIRARIAKYFPTHSILGEEQGQSMGDSDFRWIIDPLDGTKSFIHGVPLYGVMIGIEVRGASRVGVIYLPALDEMVYAGEGRGCWWNGRRASVSKVDKLHDATLVVTSPFRTLADVPAFAKLVAGTKLQRGWGDCYAYVLVATGRAEIAFDAQMAPWDAGPLPSILQEAGGKFTDHQGNVTIYAGKGVATNAALHAEVIAALR